MIFFCTNRGADSKHDGTINRLIAELTEAGAVNQLNLTRVVTTDPMEIVETLHASYNRITVFHFDGHARDLEGLLFAFEEDSGDSLFNFLGACPNLSLVVLNYCGRPDYVTLCEAAGISGILVTSHRLRYLTVREFISGFYHRLFFNGTAAALACAQTRDALAIVSGDGPQYTANYYGDDQLERTWLLPPDSYGEPRTIGELPSSPPPSLPPPSLPPPTIPPGNPPRNPPSANLPKEPFPGLRAYDENEAAIFLGRADESNELFRAATQANKSPLTLVSGQAGVGKSSLLQAGLLHRLNHNQYQVISLNGITNHNLFAALCHELGHPQSVNPTASAFWTNAARGKKGVILIVDQLETQLRTYKRQLQANWASRIRNNIAGDRHEFAHFCMAIQTFLRLSDQIHHRLFIGIRDEDQAVLHDTMQFSEYTPQPYRYQVPKLDEARIRTIIHEFRQLPYSTQYDFALSSALEESIIAELCSDQELAIAPYLQQTLLRLYRQRRNTLATREQYYQILLSGNQLYGQLFTDQVSKLEQTWLHYIRSGELYSLLVYVVSRLSNDPSITWAEIQTRFPFWGNRTTEFIEQLKDLYLLTEIADERGNYLKLGHPALAPVALNAQFPHSIFLRRWRLLWQYPVLWRSYLHRLGGYLHRRLTEIRQQIRGFWDNYKLWIFRRLAVAAILSGLLLCGTLARHEWGRARQRFDMTQYLGDLSTPRVFLIGEKTAADKRWTPMRDLWDRMAGVSPLYWDELQYQELQLQGVQLQDQGLHLLKDGPMRRQADETIIPVQQIAVDAEQEFIYLPSSESDIAIRNVWNGNNVAHLDSELGLITNLIADLQGAWFAYSNQTGNIHAQNMHTNEQISVTTHGAGQVVMAFGLEGKSFLISGHNGNLNLYHLYIGEVQQLTQLPGVEVTALAGDSSGQVTAYATADNRIHLWDNRIGMVIKEWVAHTSRIKSLEFRPDGIEIISTSDDYTVHIWPLAAHRAERQLDRASGVLPLARSIPQTALIITNNDAGKVNVWNSDTQKLLETRQVATAPITALAISPDGQAVIFATANGKVSLWQLASYPMPMCDTQP